MEEVKPKNKITYRTQIQINGKQYGWGIKIPIDGNLKKAVSDAHRLSKIAFLRLLGVE